MNSLTGKTLPADAPVEKSAGKYVVELRAMMQKPVVYEGELDGPVTVQTALDRSGATKKFRNMEITILRVVAETGRGLKMPVKYSPAKKMVTPEQDYAILPNDRIVVEPSANNTLAKMVNSLGIK